MILQIIALRDIVANVYGQPQFVPNLGGSIRSFGDAVNNPKKDDTISQHPEHFELWHLGTYDDETAAFEMHTPPRQLAAGANLVITKQ